MTIPSFGLKYNEVCGRVLGYQFSKPGAFHVPGAFVNDIDQVYVDGIGLSYGSPRKHIWTFANSEYDTYTGDKNDFCPCNAASTQKTQDFVGEDYYCESGCTKNSGGSACNTHAIHKGDKLWDGKDCGQAERDCCSGTQPWFHKVLDCSTSDDIELRICGNTDTDTEDVPVELYEIFVK